MHVLKKIIRNSLIISFFNNTITTLGQIWIDNILFIKFVTIVTLHLTTIYLTVRLTPQVSLFVYSSPFIKLPFVNYIIYIFIEHEILVITYVLFKVDLMWSFSIN